MAVLSRKAITSRLELDLDDRRSLVVTPLLARDEAFDDDSLDLRLGSYFLLPRMPGFPFYCPDEQSRFSFHARVHVSLGDFLVVPAHQTILGATLEFIKLPYDVAGEILTKSSVARTFTVIETAPWIHPNYRGCLTLEIANGSNTPILLYPGRRIGQLVLMQVSDCEKDGPTGPAADQELRSTYFGPVFPEPPEFKGPGHDLEAIGVPKVKVIPGPMYIDLADRRAK
jgi:dCTP deaminase